MRKLQNSNAICLPDKMEIPALSREVVRARSGQIGVRVVIGIGETDERISLRVLGYAKAVVETIRLDVPTLVNRSPIHVHLFSSATKLSFLSGSHDAQTIGQRAFSSLVTLAEALRIAGFDGTISIDLAEPGLEVPPEITNKVTIPADLQQRLQKFQEDNKSKADGRNYAIEHTPMFEDLGGTNNLCVRIFIGGKPEGVFWAIRRLVRTVAVEHGLPVNPMLGLIMFGLKRPWYHALPEEPVLGDFLVEAIETIEGKLKVLMKENHQLKRETTHALKSLHDPKLKILAQSLSTFTGAVQFARERKFIFGFRIQELIKQAL